MTQAEIRTLLAAIANVTKEFVHRENDKLHIELLRDLLSMQQGGKASIDRQDRQVESELVAELRRLIQRRSRSSETLDRPKKPIVYL